VVSGFWSLGSDIRHPTSEVSPPSSDLETTHPHTKRLQRVHSALIPISQTDVASNDRIHLPLECRIPVHHQAAIVQGPLVRCFGNAGARHFVQKTPINLQHFVFKRFWDFFFPHAAQQDQPGDKQRRQHHKQQPTTLPSSKDAYSSQQSDLIFGGKAHEPHVPPGIYGLPGLTNGFGQASQQIAPRTTEKPEQLFSGKGAFNTCVDTVGGHCEGRIHAHPSLPRQPDLAPDVGIGMAHRQKFPQGIPPATLITAYDPCRHTGSPHEHGKGGRKMLAKSLPADQKKIVHGVNPQPVRTQGIRKTIFLEKRQGCRHHVLGPGVGPGPPTAKGKGLWIPVRWQLQVGFTGTVGRILPGVQKGYSTVMKTLPDRSTGDKGVIVHDGGHGIGRHWQVQGEQVPLAVRFEYYRVAGQIRAADTARAGCLATVRIPTVTVKALENDAPPIEPVGIRDR